MTRDELKEQIREFRLFERGWMDGLGEPFDEEKLDWFEQAFAENILDQAEYISFRVYPIPVDEGNSVQVEWSASYCEYSVEIDLDSKKGYFHFLNLTTDKDVEKHLDFSVQKDWDWLLGEVLMT